ncbi:MAG: iron ABC transporter permease [Alcaligenaceae bacterium]
MIQLPSRSHWLATGKWPSALAGLIAACVLAPLLSLLMSALGSNPMQWAHLARFVIPDAALTTLLLLLGVGVAVALLGTGAAWLVTAFQFPGRKVLVWALLLPLAVPTYVVAYSYLDLMHPIGPVQSLLRTALGYQSPREFRLPDARSLWGAILILGGVLYPYVYLSARHMFLTQPANLIEAARGLGHGPFSLFFRVALPMARPAIVVGTTLALLETLNDVGASEFLGLQTLTVSIYTTWITRSDLAGAAQIALLMLVFVLSLIALERRARRRQRFMNTDQSRPMQPRPLRGWQGLTACLFCLVPVLAGFIVPVLHLTSQAILRLNQTGTVSAVLKQAALNTVMLSLAITACTVVGGLVLAWAARSWITRRHDTPGQGFARTATVGYALPGTVLAIGLLTPFALLDGWLEHFTLWFSANASGRWLLGTAAGLILACTLRLLAVASGSLEAGFARIPIAFDQLARSLGQSPLGVLLRIDLPLLRPALFAAALLVFVEAMKELPITLLLRPLNIETLATWLYGEAARGTYEEGAIAALLIVAVSILPVILLTRTQSQLKKSLFIK